MRTRLGVIGITILAGAGCRPSDILRVPAPAGVLPSSAVQSQAGAESVFNGAKAQVFNAVGSYNGLFAYGGLLTDEFTRGAFSFGAWDANIDARITVGRVGFQESGDLAWVYLVQARSALVTAMPQLTTYEPASGRPKVGEAYALTGYAELLLAESYCAGTPLSTVVPGSGVRYGGPLSTDSLLRTAVGHFDSAAAAASGNAVVVGLAGVGLGRALLDLGQYADAAVAVQNVPTSFVYNTSLPLNYSYGALQEPTLYAYGTTQIYERLFNVADREGQNGLNFVSAHDPRLVLDTTQFTMPDGTAWRVPTKFEANLSYIPLATGVEARLIEAEAALQAQQVGTWASDLNALRTNAPSTYLAVPSAVDTLSSDSTTAAAAAERVDVMFRERAFWLFGTGTRLGDLRRLIRQYGRNTEQVFPTGPYAPAFQSQLPSPIPNYGTDVSLTLPTSAEVIYNVFLGGDPNPNYKGCIVSTKTA